jgi:FMN phosphatase YigB (HAD superfamily)
VPTGDAVRNLGGPSNRLNTIYATNGTINTSDIREKKNIVKSDLGLEFINKLNPVKYNWIDRDNKTHYGLIAQEIESLNIDNFGALHIEDDKFGLNYIEFIAPIIKAVQELKAELDQAKAEIEILKNK